MWDLYSHKGFILPYGIYTPNVGFILPCRIYNSLVGFVGLLPCGIYNAVNNQWIMLIDAFTLTGLFTLSFCINLWIGDHRIVGQGYGRACMVQLGPLKCSWACWQGSIHLCRDRVTAERRRKDGVRTTVVVLNNFKPAATSNERPEEMRRRWRQCGEEERRNARVHCVYGRDTRGVGSHRK